MSPWPVKPLGEIADTALGKMLDKGKPKGLPHVPYLRNVNVQWGRIDVDDLLTMELADDQRERFGVAPGDLLVCEGGEIGRCAIWQGGSEYIAYQKALHRIRPGELLEAKFLRYLLEHQAGDGTLAAFATGSTIAHLPQQQLRRVPVPLPPVDEQRRIVGLLEDHFSRLDAADSYLRAAERRAEAWRAATVENELSSADYVMRPVAELLREGMRNGRSDRAVRGAEPGPRTLTLTAVTRNQFSDEFTKLTSTPAERANGLWLEPGDILVQRSNTPELVGTAARYDGPRNWAIFPDLLIRLRPDESVVDGRFLVAALRSERIHRTLRARAKGLAGSMPKIDQRAIAETMVPVPSPERQLAAVERITDIEAAASVMTAELARQRQRSAALRRSLLAAAFSGRLTSSSDLTSMSEELQHV